VNISYGFVSGAYCAVKQFSTSVIVTMIYILLVITILKLSWASPVFSGTPSVIPTSDLRTTLHTRNFEINPLNPDITIDYPTSLYAFIGNRSWTMMSRDKENVWVHESRWNIREEIATHMSPRVTEATRVGVSGTSTAQCQLQMNANINICAA
jgi:hypothetical protein